jgi:hypothetical protein
MKKIRKGGETAMLCQRCGMKNRQGSHYCRGCAAPILVAQPPQFNQGYGAQSQQFNQSYGAQPHQFNQGYGVQPQEKASGRSIAAMLMSLVGMLFCFSPLTLAGMILGKSEMNAINNGNGSPAGLGFAKTGFFVGLCVTALHALFVFTGIVHALLTTN